jgi:hypothetical protein
MEFTMDDPDNLIANATGNHAIMNGVGSFLTFRSPSIKIFNESNVLPLAMNGGNILLAAYEDRASGGLLVATGEGTGFLFGAYDKSSKRRDHKELLIMRNIISYARTIGAKTGVGSIPTGARSAAVSRANLAPFFGVWNKSGFHGGYVKVIISGSPERPRVHLWGAASPQDTDYGEEHAFWDGSALTSTFRQDGGSTVTVFRLTLDQNASLQLNCHSTGSYNGDCVAMSGYIKTPLDVGGDDTPQTPR